MRCLLLAALFSVAAAGASWTLNFQVEPQREDCFYEEVNAGDDVDVKGLVYRGGKLDIRLRVEAPDRNVLYDHLIFSNIDDSTGGLLPTIIKKGHRFTAPSSGTYRICMDNRMARWTAKVVTLDVAIQRTTRDFNAPHLTRSEGDESPQTGINIIKDSASRIMDRLALVSELQHYHFWREQRHRDTAESTNTRVQWWNFAEMMSWIGLLVAQVLLIRQWFTKKDFMSRTSVA